jgi:D-xylose transport system permease protein
VVVTSRPPTWSTTASRSAAGLVEAVRRRVRAGTLGPWPVLIGLLVIGAVFEALSSSFLSAQNLYFLTVQIAAVGAIAVGVVLVLLLGEIDLSVGSVSGVAGAALAVCSVRYGVPDWLAVLAALALGATIGTAQGLLIARVGVPAFVVTLGGLMGWQGLQLSLLGTQGSINLPYSGGLATITHTNLTRPAGWLLGLAIVLGYLALAWRDRRRRERAGLAVAGPVPLAVRTGGLAVVCLGTVAVLNAYAGVPLSLVILLSIVAAFDLLLRRTRFGRSVFAIGGNLEAARRAGINVTAVRVTAFALCATLAAVGGVLAASRGYAANQSSGGGDALLMAIAAAVIGGTSLFGGRGSTYSALLGMLVLGSIQSGMFLLDLDASVRYMITAAVLVGAVVLDSLSRGGARLAQGRTTP